MSTILMLAGILLMIGKASSYYNKSFDGYTFIMPVAVLDRSSSRLLELSFSEAQQWCAVNVAGSTLATIRNKDVQRNVDDFIEGVLQNKNHVVRSRNTNFRVNGKYRITDEWRWVNGRPKLPELTVHERNYNPIDSLYGRLFGLDYSIYSAHRDAHWRFICEYPAGKSGRCDFSLNGRCYQNNRNWLKWYEARNECMDGGGDLASFETLSDTNINASLKDRIIYLNVYYWIGLQKNEWRWEDTGTAIKYTNWENNRTSNNSGHCLCLTRSQREWKECDCSQPHPFFCILNETSTQILSPTNELENTSVISETARLAWVLSSCALIVVIIIVVVSVVCIIRKQRNRPVNSSRIETREAKTAASTNEFSFYEELQEHRGNDATYAALQQRISD